jgi:hypothetical protein
MCWALLPKRLAIWLVLYRCYDIPTCIERDFISRQTEPTATISGLSVTLDNSRPCLYIQVKAVTHFMAEGPWSDAFCLELPHSAPTQPSTVESNAGGQSSGSGGDDGEVVYIVVAVVLVLLVCVVAVFVIFFLVYYPTLRNKKQKRIVRHSSPLISITFS